MMFFPLIQPRIGGIQNMSIPVNDGCRSNEGTVTRIAGLCRAASFQRYRFSQDNVEKVIYYLVLSFLADIFSARALMPAAKLKFQAGTIQRLRPRQFGSLSISSLYKIRFRDPAMPNVTCRTERGDHG